MRVLVTGASGFIGTGVARALRAAGHEVVGVARSAVAAQQLRVASVEPAVGSLEDPIGLARLVATADAVVHAAFARFGTDDMGAAATVETAAVRAMLAAVGDRPFIYTSGLGVLGDTGPAVLTGTDPVVTPPGMAWRRQLELDTLAAGHGIVIRPPLVYGRAGGLVLTGLIRAAAATGVSRYPLPGTNAWPNVHIDDLSTAYALALAPVPAATVIHAVGGSSTPRAVAESIGRLIGNPAGTHGLPADQAHGVVPFADWLGTTQHIDATTSRNLLGWQPQAPTVTDDIENGSYRNLLE